MPSLRAVVCTAGDGASGQRHAVAVVAQRSTGGGAGLQRRLEDAAEVLWQPYVGSLLPVGVEEQPPDLIADPGADCFGVAYDGRPSVRDESGRAGGEVLAELQERTDGGKVGPEALGALSVEPRAGGSQARPGGSCVSTIRQAGRRAGSAMRSARWLAR